jgi:hypothetical protein
VAAGERVSGDELPDADFINRLVFAPEGDTDGWDLSDLPPLDAPVVHRHVVEVDPETERVLRVEAAARGVTVDELILSRLRPEAA